LTWLLFRCNEHETVGDVRPEREQRPSDQLIGTKEPG
jgi:hypothetical protein